MSFEAVTIKFTILLRLVLILLNSILNEVWGTNLF